MRRILLLQDGEGVDDIRRLERHLINDALLHVIVPGVEDPFLQAEVLVIVLAEGASRPLSHPLRSVSPIVRAKRKQIQHVCGFDLI